jgi:hypothetical protein
MGLTISHTNNTRRSASFPRQPQVLQLWFHKYVDIFGVHISSIAANRTPIYMVYKPFKPAKVGLKDSKNAPAFII